MSQFPKMARVKAKTPVRRTTAATGLGRKIAAPLLRKPRRYRPGTVALRQISKYQRSVDTIIPKVSFQGMVREISRGIKSDIRFQSTALLALQEAAEAYAVAVFERTQKCAVHAKRKTIMPRDVHLQRILAGESRFPRVHTLSQEGINAVCEKTRAADVFNLICYDNDREDENVVYEMRL